VLYWGGMVWQVRPQKEGVLVSSQAKLAATKKTNIKTATITRGRIRTNVFASAEGKKKFILFQELINTPASKMKTVNQ